MNFANKIHGNSLLFPPLVTSLRHSRPSQTSNLADGMYSCGDALVWGVSQKGWYPKLWLDMAKLWLDMAKLWLDMASL